MKYSFRFFIIAAAFAIFWSCEDSSNIVSDNSDDAQLRRGNVSDDVSALDSRRVPEFEITIYNLAPATGPGASQPMSPPVVIAHSRFADVFQVGQNASPELAQLAEDAVSDPLVDALKSSPFVFDVATGDGVIFPGSSSTVRIKARAGFRNLSIVSMLVNTNDAFAGLDAMRIPNRGSRTIYLNAYDAGSERNTESFDHIPGPCCGNPLVRVPTSEPVSLHSGIQGNGDLDTDIYGWDEPVAKITITRIN